LACLAHSSCGGFEKTGDKTGNSRSGLLKADSGVIGLKWPVVVVVGLKKRALDPLTVILGL
jgi:hypothetical protein